MLTGQNSIDDLGYLENVARKIEPNSYNEAKMAYGMIAAIKGDVDGVYRQFNAAIMNSGHDPQVLSNFSAALLNIQKTKDAIAAMDKAIEVAPDDPNFLFIAIDTNLKAFNIEGAKKFRDQLSKLIEIPHDFDESFTMKSEFISQLLEANGATWIDIANRLDFVGRELHNQENKLRFVTQSYCDDSIVFSFVLDADVEEAVKAEGLLHEKIASLPFSPADTVVAFSCEPYERTAN